MIGPYDDSNRYWLYLKWAKEIFERSLEVDEEGNEVLLSLVFSEDIADLIIKLLQSNDNQKIIN